MKKIVLTLVVLAVMAVPVMADGTVTFSAVANGADVDVIMTVDVADSGDGPVGVALEVDVDAGLDLTDVVMVDSFFDIFMDLAYDEVNGDGYIYAEGNSAIARAAARGQINAAGSQASIADSMAATRIFAVCAGGLGGETGPPADPPGGAITLMTISGAAGATATITGNDFRNGPVVFKAGGTVTVNGLPLAIQIPQQYTVTLDYDGTGSGTTTLDPVGPYLAGTSVDPTPNADPGSVFVAFDQSDPFIVNSNMTLTTTYNLIPLDFGDAPDTSPTTPIYPTLLAHPLVGASHIIGGPFLGPDGDEPDPETDGQPNLTATGDDIAGATPDDEDNQSVTGLTTAVGGGAGVANFEVNGPAGPYQVDIWVDLNGDGDWLDTGELVFSGVRAVGIYAEPLVIAGGAVITQTLDTCARFRINDGAPLECYGPADNGEVEDYCGIEIAGDVECVKDGPSGGDPTHYADWVGAGKNWNKPDCWCYNRQCRGDADGIKQGTARVSTFDLDEFLAAFGKADFKMDQVTICSDYDHKKQGTARVSTDDLNIFLAYFGKADFKNPVCPLDWDGVGGDDYNFWIPTPSP